MRTTPRVAYEPFRRDTWRDPFPLYRQLRDEDPVHRSPAGFWVLSRFEHVFAAARDTTTFSSAHGLTFRNEKEELGLAPTIVMMDPPDHTRYRRLASRGFTPRHVTELEPDVRRFIRERVDELRAAGTSDFVAGLARPLPSWVVAHYLGVPEEGPAPLRGLDAGHRASERRGSPARRRGGARRAVRLFHGAHRPPATRAGR